MVRYLALAALCACGNQHAGKVSDASSDSSVDAVAVLDASACAVVPGTRLAWRLIAKTAGPGVIVVSPPQDSRLFVVEQEGRIKVLADPATTFLDISNRIAYGGELGLLGLAFDPAFASNGVFYIFYTTGNANVLSRFHVSAQDPNIADLSSETIMLSISDHYSNHHGGMLEFSPTDGDLYVSTGDGGGVGDPDLNGQNPRALLGKILRIDPRHDDGGKHYTVPADNPYANGIDGAPETMFFGLRNAWRWAFDMQSGDMWIGDVGQADYEELDLVPKGFSGGLNFGWSMYEGASCYKGGNGNGTCSPLGITMPQFVANHTDGWCAIIGGDVYRGSCFPDLAGSYLFTDYCKAELEVAKKTGDFAFDVRPASEVSYVEGDTTHAGSPPSPSSLHSAANGDVYMTTVACCGDVNTGGVYRLEVQP